MNDLVIPRPGNPPGMYVKKSTTRVHQKLAMRDEDSTRLRGLKSTYATLLGKGLSASVILRRAMLLLEQELDAVQDHAHITTRVDAERSAVLGVL